MTEIARQELLQIADALAREKGLTKQEVIDISEQAIQKIAKARYGSEYDIRATIDQHTGHIYLARHLEVVETASDPHTQISVQNLPDHASHLQVGDCFIESLPSFSFGHAAAQSAKQTLFQGIRELERHRHYEEFKDKVGELVSGAVKRVEFGNVTIELGKAEGFLRRDELIPRENFRPGDRVRAYVREVRNESRGPQIFLSRTHPQFMSKLFAQEVPEIYDGLITIQAVARDPGSHAKIAVSSKEVSIDPVGSCVGMRGSRVQAVVQELQGEKVDIVPWSPDIATFVVNALAPAAVTKVIMAEDDRRLTVVVSNEQLSLAIGRRGQNIRLACELTQTSIEIITEEEDSKKRAAEVSARSQLFMDALDVDEVIAHLLVGEGFEFIEDIAYVDQQEILNLEGFTEELCSELQSRAVKYLEKKCADALSEYEGLGGSPELANLEGLTPVWLLALAQNGIKTLDDLADLSGEELQDVLKDSAVTAQQANKIIIAARAHWFPQTLDQE